MKVVFISNYYTHHQSELSMELHKEPGCEFYFMETSAMTQERKNMGWGTSEIPDFVLPPATTKVEYQRRKELADTADVVIWGSAPDAWVRRRLRQGKLTFRYSERVYKSGCPAWQIPLRAIKNAWRFGFSKQLYLLCASAYTAGDYQLTGNFLGRAYQWGYFPECRRYDISHLMQQKAEKQTIKLLWAGRFLGWKHPEMPVMLAQRLAAEGYSFELDMIGGGEQFDRIQAMIQEKGLQNSVHLLGTMKPEDVRRHMEDADIFLFTSDFNEGWGAVLNEAMNSGCAVAASHAIGAVPFLVQDGINGMIFENGNQEDLFQKVSLLMENRELRQRIARNAYAAIAEKWNAQITAQRFFQLVAALQQSGKCDLFADGPCSRAPIIKNGWFTDNG